VNEFYLHYLILRSKTEYLHANLAAYIYVETIFKIQICAHRHDL